MPNLTTSRPFRVLGVNDVPGSQKVDGSTNEIFFGALLSAGAAGAEAVRYDGAGVFAGLSLGNTDQADLSIPVLKEFEMKDLTIGGTPVVGALVYPNTNPGVGAASDNIDDLHTTNDGFPAVGRITAWNGALATPNAGYTVKFSNNP